MEKIRPSKRHRTSSRFSIQTFIQKLTFSLISSIATWTKSAIKKKKSMFLKRWPNEPESPEVLIKILHFCGEKTVYLNKVYSLVNSNMPWLYNKLTLGF